MKRKRTDDIDVVSIAKKKISDPIQALEKASSYCAYQERCQQEVRDKLFEWGLWPEAVEDIIMKLITQDYLNEERFARSFARGKFRIKKWGRVKIKIELRKRKISDYCVKSAMKEIEEDVYLETLKKVATEKLKTLREKHHLKKKYKLMQYLLSRGFEHDLVNEVAAIKVTTKK